MSEAQLVRENPFALKRKNNGGEVSLRDPSAMDAVISRAAQEVQAAMIIAKKYPRDEMRAWDKIMKACERPSLAEKAAYSYPKGGTNVFGPSIRLAECLARAWGNIDFGLIELNQSEGKSEMMAYAWDLETNCRETKIFTVNHSIEKKGGNQKILTDPRDIYELTANQGARRMRACILAIIPGDVVDDALDKCDATLANAEKTVPLADRIKKVITVFDGIGVTIGMIEKRFAKKLDKIGEQELVQLRKIYTSIRDGFSKISDQFEPHVDKPNDLEKPPTTRAADSNEVAEKQEAEKPKREPKAAKAGTPLSQLQAMMVLESVSEGEVIEVLVRKAKGMVPVNELKDAPEVALNWSLANSEILFSQIRMDRKNNQQPN